MNLRSSKTVCLLVLGVSLAALVGVPVPSRTTGAPAAAAVDPNSPFGTSGGPIEYVQYQAALGAARTGNSLNWGDVEPSQDNFTWSATDGDFALIRDAGLVAGMKLRTCGRLKDGSDFWGTKPAPFGAKLPPGICASLPPVRWRDYTDFVERAVGRYKDPAYAGLPVRQVSIGNEVNDRNQWPGVPGRTRCVIDEATGQEDCPVFQDYLQLLRRAYAAAHRANPDVVVLDAGLGSRVYGLAIARDIYEEKGKTTAALNEAVAFYNKYYSLRFVSPSSAGVFYVKPTPKTTLRARFEERIYAPYDPEADPLLGQVIGDRFYYFAKHIYDDPAAFDAIQLHFYDHWDLTDEVIDWMHRQMDENWGPGHRKPIVCSECGSHHAMLDSNGDGWAEFANYSVDDHASWLAKRFILALSRGVQQLSHVKLVWEHRPAAKNLFESGPMLCGPGTKFEPQLCGGVVDPTKWTPHGKAFKKLASTLIGYTSVTELTTQGPAVKAFRFAKPTGDIVTLWSADGSPQSVNLLQFGTVRMIRNQYGGATSGDPATFAVDNKVTYVRLR